jgi:serine/threonine protein kinase/outer membrane protein assembly factor BamB
MPDELKLPPPLDSRYVPLSHIGSGGAGSVFVVWDNVFQTACALKVIDLSRVDRSGSRDLYRESSLREARALAKLNHPNIVRIFDLQEHGDSIFIALEYLRGGSLEDLIQKRGALPPAEAVRLLKPVCEAVDYCHGHGIIHRDLKPANILLDAAPADPSHLPIVKVADFGIAKLLVDDTASHTVLGGSGSVGYLSPERLTGQPAGPGDDIYSLGVIAFRMMTGMAAALLSGQTTTSLALLPGPVRNVIARSIAPQAAQRQASALAFFRELETASAEAGIEEPQTLPQTRVWRLAVMLACAVVVLISIVGTVWWRLHSGPERIGTMTGGSPTPSRSVQDQGPAPSARSASSSDEPSREPATSPAEPSAVAETPAGSVPTTTAPDPTIIPASVPQWSQPRGTADQSGRIARSGPAGLRLDWRQDLPFPIRGSPVIASDGSLYLGSGDRILRLDPAGRVVATYALEASLVGSITGLVNGTILVPAAGSRLFVGRPGGNRFTLAMLAQQPLSTFITDGRTLFAGFGDGTWRAFNEEGRQLWASVALGSPCKTPGALAQGLLFIACGDELRALQTSDGLHRFVLQLPDELVAPPVVSPAGYFYLVTANRQLACYGLQGREVWRVTLPGVAAGPPAVGPRDTILVAVEGGSLLSVTASEIKRLFDYGGPPHGSSLLTSDDVLYQVAASDLYAVPIWGQAPRRLHLPSADITVAALSTDGALYLTGMRSLLRVSR